jgi:hypothetical protein
MKAFITPAYTFTPGAADVGTVDLSAIAGFDIKRLLAIINQTTGTLIYSTASPNLKYSALVGSVVTLHADTTGMNAADKLQILYEEIGQKSTALSNSVALSTEQESLLTDIETNTNWSLVLTGDVDSPAPASDTADATINGRLKRIAQRISSLIDLHPGSLGQKASAASLAVVISTEQQTILSSLATKLDSLITLGAAPALSAHQTQTPTSAVVKTFTMPAGAKKMVVQNSMNAGGAVRFVPSTSTPTAVDGYYLGVGQSTSEMSAGSIKVIATTAAEDGDVTVLWS